MSLYQQQSCFSVVCCLLVRRVRVTVIGEGEELWSFLGDYLYPRESGLSRIWGRNPEALSPSRVLLGFAYLLVGCREPAFKLAAALGVLLEQADIRSNL